MRAQLLTWVRWKKRLPHLLDILEGIPVSVFLCFSMFCVVLILYSLVLVSSFLPCACLSVWLLGYRGGEFIVGSG